MESRNVNEWTCCIKYIFELFVPGPAFLGHAVKWAFETIATVFFTAQHHLQEKSSDWIWLPKIATLRLVCHYQ